MNKNLTTYVAVLICSSFLFFFLNRNHDLQHAIYQNYYLPLANSLVQGHGYILDGPNSEPRYFPMWGYSLILAIPIALGIPPDVFILGAQWILCLLGVFLCYKMFEIEPRGWHIIILIPWFALMSVKWPEALNGILVVSVLFFVWRFDMRGKGRYLLFAAIASGIALQFRTEMLLWPIVVVILVSGVTIVKIPGTPRLNTAVLFFLVSLFTLLPWSIRGYVNTGRIAVGSSNGGAVFYIGLGQLPNNPWGIAYNDTSAFAFAKAHGESDPWSPQANEMFVREDLRLVTEYPLHFLLKCAYVGGRTLIGGCFTGELPTFVESGERLNAVRSQLAGGKWEFFLHNLSVPEQLYWLIQVTLIFGFRIAVFVFFVLFARSLIRMKIPQLGWLDVFVVGLVLSKLITTMLVQYEGRHINLVYLPLVGWLIYRRKLETKGRAACKDELRVP